MDSYQGHHPRRIAQSLRFLRDINRLVVASSRARDAFYVIANKTCIHNSKPQPCRYIKRYLSQILAQQYYITEEQIDCPYYTHGDVGLATIYNIGPEEDTKTLKNSLSILL